MHICKNKTALPAMAWTKTIRFRKNTRTHINSSIFSVQNKKPKLRFKKYGDSLLILTKIDFGTKTKQKRFDSQKHAPKHAGPLHLKYFFNSKRKGGQKTKRTKKADSD